MGKVRLPRGSIRLQRIHRVPESMAHQSRGGCAVERRQRAGQSCALKGTLEGSAQGP